MKERSFIDTNILVYTDDAANPKKQQQAMTLLQNGWGTGNLLLSTQVLQEYFDAATCKLGVPVEIAQQKLELLGQLDVASIQHDDILRAVEILRLHQFSFWDALIVHMAQKTACTVLYSEDMQHGRKMGALKIINPFLD